MKPLWKPAKVVCHMPATYGPNYRGEEKIYFVPIQGQNFYLLTDSKLMVQAASERSRQHQPKSTPSVKEVKHLDFFSWKVSCSTNLQFWMANYQALIAKYNFWAIKNSQNFQMNFFQMTASPASTFQTQLSASKQFVRTVESCEPILLPSLPAYTRIGGHLACFLNSWGDIKLKRGMR